MPLSDMLRFARAKFPEIDQNLILKSLVYFNDITSEPIRFTAGHVIYKRKRQSGLLCMKEEFMRKNLISMDIKTLHDAEKAGKELVKLLKK